MSTTEDDNPPSPIVMDAVDVFSISQQPSIGSPASRRQDSGLRFPSPMTPPSNPHTPASPARMQGVSFPLQTG
jgi:mediator of RNA polymerase II transcription subunit 14